VKTADGRLVDVEVSINHLEAEGGRIVCFLHDVTEAKAAAASLVRERSALSQRVAERTVELSRANEELAHASRLKDGFLASMSHELRTPLTAILGLSDLLLSGGRGPMAEAQARAVGMIQESGRHLRLSSPTSSTSRRSGPGASTSPLDGSTSGASARPRSRSSHPPPSRSGTSSRSRPRSPGPSSGPTRGGSSRSS